MISRKTGLSNVVAMILLILLVFAAISVLVGFLLPAMKIWLYCGSACLNHNDYFYFEDDLGYNCYSDDGYAISVAAHSVESSGTVVEGMRFVIFGSGGSSVVDIYDGDQVGGKIRMLDSGANYEVPLGGEARTYVYQADPEESVERVKVFAIVSDEECGESICEESTEQLRMDFECEGEI